MTGNDARLARLDAIDAIIARRQRPSPRRAAASRGPRLRDLVMDFFKQHPGRWTTRDVGERLGRQPKEIAARVTELVREGLLTAHDDGYTIAL